MMPFETVVETAHDFDDLRATLRLCFGATAAERLASLLGTERSIDRTSLRPLSRAARIAFHAAKLTSLRADADPGRPILGPRRKLTPGPALALSLHLGLALTADELSEVMGWSIDRTGEALMCARQAAGDGLAPCPDFTSSLGRYRDAGTDRDETLALMLHLGHCPRCRLALDSARAFDERVLGELHDIRANLAPFAPVDDGRVSLLARPSFLGVTALCLALLLILGGIAGADVFHGAAPSPAPLLVPAASSVDASGWLLETSSGGEVDALNVSTGAWHELVRGQPSGTARSLISPDQHWVAQVMSNQATGHPDHLRIFTLAGTLVHDWSLVSEDAVQRPLGWYGNSTIVLSRIPRSAYGGSAEDLATQADQHGSLSLFDVRTGDQRAIFDHAVRSVVPSPDGKFLAIARYSMGSGRTIEIRPFDGNQVGPVLSTIDDIGLPYFWMPDSQHLLFTLIEPLVATRIPRKAGDRGLPGQTSFSFAIATQNVEGQHATLLTFPDGGSGHVVGLSPDGRQMIYLQQSNPPSATDWAFWQRGVDGGEPVRLAPEVPDVGGESVAWSPAGDAFVTSAEPYYLAQSASIPLSAGPTSYAIMMFGADGRSSRVLMDQLDAPVLSGFVADQRLVANGDAPRMTRVFGGAQPVSGLAGSLSLVDQSRISPDGDRVLSYDRASNLYVGVVPDGTIATSQVGLGSDPAWTPDGSGLIAVSQETLQQSVRSRIALYGSGTLLDGGQMEFDPANLGDASRMSYRLPRLAPDGLDCSFFVAGDRQMSLWLAGRGRAPQPVMSWESPPDVRVDLPLVAEWIDRRTLIIAVPDGWSSGYPLRGDLRAIRLQPDGTVQVDTLKSWSVRGNDRGLAIAALSLSPDGAKLAVRVRHFSSALDTFDVVDVMRPGADSSPIELARGPAASGIGWSPDGNELALAIGRRIAVASWTGADLTYLPLDSGAYALPLWVSPNEIWLARGSGSSSSIVRVTR